jgi:hypothetical protein
LHGNELVIASEATQSMQTTSGRFRVASSAMPPRNDGLGRSDHLGVVDLDIGKDK